MGRRWVRVHLALLAALAAVAATTGVALASGSVLLDKATGAPGDTIGVTGAGFQPFEGFQLFWDPGQSTQAQLGGGQADSRGGFTTPITVPQGAQPGSHQVAALGQRSGPTQPAPFTVAQPAVATAAPVTPSPTAAPTVAATPTAAATATPVPATVVPQQTTPAGGMKGSSGWPWWLILLLALAGIVIIGAGVYYWVFSPRRPKGVPPPDDDDDDDDDDLPLNDRRLRQELTAELAALVAAKVGTSPGNCVPVQIPSSQSDPNDYVYCKNVDCTGVCHVFWMPRRKPRGGQWPDWEDTGKGSTRGSAVIKEEDKVYICSCV